MLSAFSFPQDESVRRILEGSTPSRPRYLRDMYLSDWISTPAPHPLLLCFRCNSHPHAIKDDNHMHRYAQDFALQLRVVKSRLEIYSVAISFAEKMPPLPPPSFFRPSLTRSPFLAPRSQTASSTACPLSSEAFLFPSTQRRPADWSGRGGHLTGVSRRHITPITVGQNQLHLQILPPQRERPLLTQLCRTPLGCSSCLSMASRNI